MRDVDNLRRVGDALAAAMSYRGATPADVARVVGVSRDTVYRWLSGKHGMSLEDCRALADMLDAPAELLVRPPATRSEAMAMIASWDARAATAPASPSPDLASEMQAWAETVDEPSPRPRPAPHANTERS